MHGLQARAVPRDLIHDSTATISASVSTPSYTGIADW